jgi:hypothetical protein
MNNLRLVTKPSMKHVTVTNETQGLKISSVKNYDLLSLLNNATYHFSRIIFGCAASTIFVYLKRVVRRLDNIFLSYLRVLSMFY